MNTSSFRAFRASLPCVARVIALATLSSSLLAQSMFAAPKNPGGGDTNPPAGPVVITSSTTPGDEDSVFRIAQPGSYVLGENVLGAAGKSGIEISAPNVTINLNGFTLQGAPGSVDGIRIVATETIGNVTIANGTVTGWGRYGVNLSGPADFNAAHTSVIERIHASHNTSAGILSAWNTTITNCTAHDNGGDGISANGYSVVEGCTATGNGATGINVFFGSARGSSSVNNGQNGFLTSAGTIVDCTASHNEAAGFYLMNSGVVQNCSAWENQGYGMRLGSGSTMQGSVSRNNTAGGVYVVGYASVLGNTVIALRLPNGPNVGIDLRGNGSLVENNAVSYGHIGIRVIGTSGGNRIEGNNLVTNDVGLKVESTGNLIARNSARSDVKNYQIVAGNRVGTVIAPAVNSAIDGNAGGGIGTTDPWSNIAY